MWTLPDASNVKVLDIPKQGALVRTHAPNVLGVIELMPALVEPESVQTVQEQI